MCTEQSALCEVCDGCSAMRCDEAVRYRSAAVRRSISSARRAGHCRRRRDADAGGGDRVWTWTWTHSMCPVLAAPDFTALSAAAAVVFCCKTKAQTEMRKRRSSEHRQQTTGHSTTWPTQARDRATDPGIALSAHRRSMGVGPPAHRQDREGAGRRGRRRPLIDSGEPTTSSHQRQSLSIAPRHCVCVRVSASHCLFL